MAEKVSAGSVPIATATSSRRFFFSATAIAAGRRGVCRAGGSARRLCHYPHARRACIAGSISDSRRSQPLAQMLRGYLLPLPVHACRLPIVDLHAIHAHVSFPALWIAGNHAGQGNKAAAIQWPALKDGKVQDAEIFSQDHLLARRVFGRNGARKKPPHFRQHGKHLQLLQKTFRRFELEQALDALRHVIQAIHIERKLHAPLAAELVHQHPAAWIPLHVLEQQRGAVRLGHPIGNLCHLQNGIHGLVDVL